MNANDYQTKAHSFATGGGDTLVYALLGLAEEVGELLEKTNVRNNYDVEDFVHLTEILGSTAKYIRKNWDGATNAERNRWSSALEVKAEKRDAVVAELGDVLWMLANAAHHIGISLEEVMERNVAKLDERVATGTIVGSGDTVAERLANARKEADNG